MHSEKFYLGKRADLPYNVNTNLEPVLDYPHCACIVLLCSALPASSWSMKREKKKYFLYLFYYVQVSKCFEISSQLGLHQGNQVNLVGRLYFTICQLMTLIDGWMDEW